MTSHVPSYHGYRFPPEIISHAVWLYHRFGLSFRDAEDLLAQRGITVTYETIRQWCQTFGLDYVRTLRRRRGRMGDTWHLDELFVTIRGRRQYLWRAVDQDGDVIDILVQSRRDRHAAARFFRKLLKRQGRGPLRLVTDKLRSYAAAHRTVMPTVMHSTRQYENNRAEVSHQPTRQRERQMRGFNSVAHAQRFLSVHGVVLNLFRVGRHLLSAVSRNAVASRSYIALGVVPPASATVSCPRASIASSACLTKCLAAASASAGPSATISTVRSSGRPALLTTHAPDRTRRHAALVHGSWALGRVTLDPLVIARAEGA